MNGFAFVTGGGSGIGAATCRQLAAQGWRVAVVDICAEAAKQVSGTLSGAGHLALRCDVTDEAQVAAAFDACEKTGPVTALVTAAGGTANTPTSRPKTSELTLAEWNQAEALNSRSVFLCCREYLRRREARPAPGGRIVTIASAAAQRGSVVGGVAYSSAKGAVISFTKCLALEVAPLGITVNTVSPGPIDTPAYHTANNSAQAAAMIKGVPLQRLGSPDELAAAIVFLLSPGAAYITGTTLDVNGGTHMH